MSNMRWGDLCMSTTAFASASASISMVEDEDEIK